MKTASGNGVTRLQWMNEGRKTTVSEYSRYRRLLEEMQGIRESLRRVEIKLGICSDDVAVPRRGADGPRSFLEEDAE